MNMHRPRVLIVTNGHLSRNPRPLKEAQTLGAAGYEVTVLLVRNHPSSDTFDIELLRHAPFRCECVGMLPKAGARSLAPLVRRAEGWLHRFVARFLGIRSIRALGPARALLARARQLPADLTIVHNEVPHWVGLQLLNEGRLVAADIEDWHSEDLLPSDRIGRPLALLRTHEQALLHRCAYTTTTSHALADALHARYGGTRPHVLTNSFPLQPAPVPRAPEGPAKLFWFSQTLGPGRGLEPFVSAWGQTQERSRLVLVGEDRSDFGPQLRHLVSPHRRGDLELCSPVPPTELPTLAAAHDIGLALEDRAIVNRDLTITNKILQYLNAGLAVIASDTAGQREVLSRNPAAGLIVGLRSRDRLSSSLDELLADADKLARCRAAARSLAEHVYCWEREEPRLLALVEAALAAPSS